MSLRVLEVLARLPIADVDGIVISGPDNPALDALHRKVEQMAVRFRIESDPSDMPGLLSWAELALSGGGSTLWELAFMGIPTVAFITAENQAKAVAALESRGLVRSVRGADKSGELARIVEGLARDRATRQQMSRAGRELVDGMGVKRVLKVLPALG
jgi:spore coat polysaccharide biosynthesis predicted glycosyltransferase SpsG